jgi:hypothetical protein
VWHRLGPGVVVAIVCSLYVAVVLVNAGGDPLAFAVIGTRFSAGDVLGSEGYDGQFVYFIARDPLDAARFLDVPAYRYQRILYPLLAWLFSGGQPGVLPWTLILINLAAIVAGTCAVEQLLRGFGVNRWYALAYGLYGGQLIALRTDLNEPLALALVSAAMLGWHRDRRWLAAVLFALASLTKETSLVFVAAYAIAALVQRRWRAVIALACATLPFALFQATLWVVFGRPGLGAGGAGATPFSPVPLGGWLEVAGVSAPAFLTISVVAAPFVVLPAVIGTLMGLHDLLRRPWHPIALSLLLNSWMIMALPASTFREPAALLRLGGGLALSMILYGAIRRLPRVQNYSLLWILSNLVLLKGVA